MIRSIAVMGNALTAKEVIRSLSATEIRLRLNELEAEAKALRTLLRAAIQVERGLRLTEARDER